MSVNAFPWQARTIHCAGGIVPTQYRVVNVDDGTTVRLGPFTGGITNTGTLRYKATPTIALVPGDYEIQWDDGSGTWAVVEDLTVAHTYVH